MKTGLSLYVTERVRLTIIDPQKVSWTVPAELIESPKQLGDHEFALHKSLSLDDEMWVVTHVGTGGKVSGEATKRAAIFSANVALHALSQKRFAGIVKKAIASGDTPTSSTT